MKVPKKPEWSYALRVEIARIIAEAKAKAKAP